VGYSIAVAGTVVAEALDAFVIEGGRRLSGHVRTAGNKNAVLPILAACVLTSEPVELSNVPRIRDVETMVELLAEIGADLDWQGDHELRVSAANANRYELSEELSRRLRTSILFAGPLLARFGRAVLPLPGGDPIGRRRLDVHIHALSQLGAEIDFHRRFDMRADGLTGTTMYLDEPSVTGTENAVMAATLARGETVIVNAASEPHVQDLCHFLVARGARISGIGSNVIRIEGVRELGGGEWHICPDHIEVGSFIGCAAVTGGDVTIEAMRPADLVSILPGLERLGIRVEVGETSVRVPPDQELVIQDDLGGQLPKIEDGPWPLFPADMTSIALIVATQARGTVLIFEKMFESRLFFVDKLINMGARVILCDPHRVVVTGPSQLYGQRMESPDVRAGWAMLIAALCAEGTSTIANIRWIDRGYERVDERLRSLGAQIERVES
jgi:UDP-N-acetylglucosamine 1-carboxyvinyltransferase